MTLLAIILYFDSHMMCQQEIHGCDVTTAVFGFGSVSVCTNSGFLNQICVDGEQIY